MSEAVRVARCPQCGQPAVLAKSNPFRPFCSERCRMLDFGAWIGGRYAIPVAGPEPDPDEPAEDDEDGERRLQ